MKPRIPRRIVPSVRPARLTPNRVEREFRGRLAAGAGLRPRGAARRAPRGLLTAGYTPKHKVELFDTTYYLTNPRQNEDLRFFVGYVVQEEPGAPAREIHPRIFYKDISLVWRSASHYIRTAHENWIGKGDLRVFVENGEERESSDESSTDLPLEIQTAFENLNRTVRRVPYDDTAVGLVLRRAPADRIEAYEDFRKPRRQARENPRNRVYGGRSIARFTRPNDPSSLRFAAGYQPDFGRGILEVSASTSRLYGGRIRRFRIVSSNRRVQYVFMAAPKHVWIIPAQATTTELSSYGVRTVDVVADDDLFVPGYEYHFAGGANGLSSQIPAGFAGEPSVYDPSRSDASRWLDAVPVIQEFRRRILRRSRRPG